MAAAAAVLITGVSVALQARVLQPDALPEAGQTASATAPDGSACLKVPQPAPFPTAQAGGETPTQAPAANATSLAGEPSNTPVIFPGTGAQFTLPDDPNAAAVLPPCPPVLVRPAAPDIFGFGAAPLGARFMAAQWAPVRDAPLDPAGGPWAEVLAQAGGASTGNPSVEQLAMVNRWVNWHVRYIDDAGGDEWADAAATMTRGYGDCEDFALAKMALLKALGVPWDDMFLVLVREKERPVDHAILGVRRDGVVYVLDNRTDLVQPAETVTEYRPTVSYSGTFAWVYGNVVGTRLTRTMPVPAPAAKR